MDNILHCPVCDQQIVSSSSRLELREVFDAWKPIHVFSEEIVDSHLKQSDYTDLYVCPNCALEIYSPQVTGTDQFYSELQRDAGVLYYREDKWDFREASKDIEKGDSIIEIGCGIGSFLLMVQSKGAHACGTEYNQDALEVARSKGLTVYNSKVDLNAIQGKFDSAFSFHVLEHVANPLEFVNDMLSLVKPGGKIGVSVPNQAGPLKYVKSVFNMPPHHVTHWQYKTFLSLAQRLNLKVLRVAYEPLLLENHNYYSFYWLNHQFPDTNRANPYIRRVLSFGMKLFFNFLMKLGVKHFKFLKGQAIYVLMVKR